MRSKSNEKFLLEFLSKGNINIELLSNYIDSKTKIQCKCRLCATSKGEALVKNILEKYNIPYECQYYISKSVAFNHSMFIDFKVIMNGQLYFIEYNGRLHYEAIDYFGGKESFAKQQLRDNYLRQYCSDHKIILIEISHIMTLQLIENSLQVLNKHATDEFNNLADELAFNASKQIS